MGEIAESLRSQGFWKSPTPWAGIHKFMDWQRGCVTFPGHMYTRGDRTPRSLNDTLAVPIEQESPIPNQYHFASHMLGHTLKGPGLLDFLMPLTEEAEDYFDGESALLYSINAFWKKPGGHEQWHNDTDDRKIFALFMFGTDILTREDGTHGYIPGSHKWSIEEKQPYNENIKQPDEKDAVYFYGPAGTWFITDTWGLHNGVAPAQGKPARMLLWSRWGVSDPPKSYREVFDHAWPARNLGVKTPSIKHQTATRLIVDWSQ